MTNAPTSSAHSAHVAPARIELHPIRTATLSAQQFLTGDRNGEPALLAGELRLPARGTDPYPAVLLVHGSCGTRANIDFSFHDHCVTHDAHTGYNAEARTQSVKDVTAFLAQALRLKDYA